MIASYNRSWFWDGHRDPPMLGLPSSTAEAVSSDGVLRVRILITDSHCIDDHVMLQRPDG